MQQKAAFLGLLVGATVMLLPGCATPSATPRISEAVLRMSAKDAAAFAGLWVAGAPQDRAWARPTGTSMLPAIREGDVLLLQVYRPGMVIVAGDIVRFRRVIGNRPDQAFGVDEVTHRVIRVSRATVICRGDNCTADDGPVPRSSITYVVRGIIRVEGAAR